MDKTTELVEWKDLPPTIEEFIDKPEYLGSLLDGRLYPVLREALKDVYPSTIGQARFSRVILESGVGTGNSTLATIGLLYDITRLLHTVKPYRVLDHAFSAMLYFGFVGGYPHSFTQITQFVYSSSYLSSMVESKSARRIVFKNNIILQDFTSVNQLLGLALVGCMVDHARLTNDELASIDARIVSRFHHCSLRGRLWYMGDLVPRVQELDGDLLCDFSAWSTRSSLVRLSGESFKVCLRKDCQPFITDSKYKMRSKDRLITVPEEFRQGFEDNTVRALRELAGVRYERYC